MQPPRLLLALLTGALVSLTLPGADALAGPKGSAKPSTAEKSARPSKRSKSSSPSKATPKKPKPVPSESIGSPSDGRLVGGMHLEPKPYLRVVPAYAEHDRRWGHPSLINMLDRAARRVAKRYPGSVLGVGDISQRGGGDVHVHRSHESGRDADVAFYVLDAKNKPVKPKTLLRFDATLKSPEIEGARFDLPRNWLFVQELLRDPKAHVSHIFVAESLRQELLAYARKIGVAPALRTRAAFALMQPSTTQAHDDHFHVRISCPKDSAAVCVETPKEAPRGAKMTKVAKRGRGTPSTQRARRASLAGQTRHAKPSSPRVESSAPAPKPDSVPNLMRIAPAQHDANSEADADAREVKDLLDELGAFRITR
jgi:penicillin-insensitive murein endopeptidase